MKKVFTLLTITLLLYYSSFAQNEGSAYSKGSSTISVGYGLFNIWKTLLAYGGFTSASAVGPCVLKYEYGISRRISANLCVGYSQVNGNGDNGSSFTQKLTNFLIVAGANYHFLTSKKFDPYISAGFGYYNFKYSNSFGDILLFTLPSAFAISFQAGVKYYFRPHLGAYAEAGYVDGAIIQTGFTYKIK